VNLLSLKTELRQELKLTPQLLQSMEILQMNSQELLDYLNRMSEENPLLEQEESAFRGAYEELRQKVSWIDGGLSGSTFAHGESSAPERGAVDRDLTSLSAFLCDQLERLRLSKPLLALTKYMAELVDEDGYLLQEDLDGLLELKLPQAMIDQSLELIQKLEPAGVGARNLAECLLLQLSRRGNVPSTVLDIAARFLPELGKKHYGAISRALGVSISEVQAAEKVIAGLDPHPGQAFQAVEPALYIRPDVFVAELDGELRVVLNEYYLPRVSISGYYTKLLQECDEQETRSYLQEKMQQAKWLLHSLERRGSTLQRCSEAILASQRPFFLGETTELAPVKLVGLSADLGIHPSTLSRAVHGKYLQCRQGTYPLRYFFSRPVGEHGPSRQAIKQKLLRLVKEEDPCHPYSDQILCRLLADQGVDVARRTVAKYRIELGIGSSAARRR